ncbi:UNVERIFIED_CONTAM: hypothetical protein GTU68_028243 [Idotea baltica]|nr:hypothetical protein [Idotea baltica]
MQEKAQQSINFQRRFGGVARLYGDQGLQRLRVSHICVIGIGGVGSWVVEALARSGVGEISMIDMDLVAESNINRQIIAGADTLGRDKVAVMHDRIKNINPSCQVHCVDEFISRDNLSTLVNSKMDFIIDCIDDYRIKAALIHYCKSNKINILTVGGAGGQIDPSKIRQSDLSRTQHDVLLAKTRKLLRQDYKFPRNLKRSFSIPCVYSDEQLVFPNGEGGIISQRPSQTSRGDGFNAQDLPNNALNCAGGLGSITHVTGVFAFFAASHVLNNLIKAEL